MEHYHPKYYHYVSPHTQWHGIKDRTSLSSATGLTGSGVWGYSGDFRGRLSFYMLMFSAPVIPPRLKCDIIGLNDTPVWCWRSNDENNLVNFVSVSQESYCNGWVNWLSAHLSCCLMSNACRREVQRVKLVEVSVNCHKKQFKRNLWHLIKPGDDKINKCSRKKRYWGMLTRSSISVAGNRGVRKHAAQTVASTKR